MDTARREALKLAALATLVGCVHTPLASREPSATESKGAMRTRPLMTLRLSTAPTQDVGASPHGTRVTFPIIGGSFEGERFRGKVLPGGDDWTVKRSDGIMLAVGAGEIRADGPVHVIDELL